MTDHMIDLSQAQRQRPEQGYNGSIVDQLRGVLPPITEMVNDLRQKTPAGELAGPCPFCGEGDDRFIVRPDGSYWCRVCEKGGDRLDFHCRIQNTDIKGLAAKHLNGQAIKKRRKAAATDANLACTYFYKDETGKTIFEVCRYEEPGSDKAFRQRHFKNGAWVNNLQGVRRVLYNLPAVMNSQAVVIVEGEKDVDRLTALGLVATTSPMGSSNWKAEYAAFLAGKHVAIIPDNDRPGKRYAAKVAGDLHGIAASVRVVTLPGVPEKGDVSDFLDQGGTREILKGIIGAVPVMEAAAVIEPLIYVPTWDNCPPETEVLLRLNETPVLHRQNLCLLTAGAGVGKTASIHGSLPTLIGSDNETLGLSAFGHGATVLDTEHDARLFNLLWQRFMYRCGLSKGTPCPDNIRWKNVRAIDSLSERLDILWAEFASCPGLLIIDGIGDFVSDPNNSDECTALVYRLSSEAQKNNIGVLLSLHNNPVVGNEKARGVLGSELWRKAQSTLIITKDKDGICRITTEYSLGKNRQNSDRLSAYFTWDADGKMHVPCDPPEENEVTGKSIKQQQDIIVAMQGEYTHKELVELVMGIAGVKQRQATNKIKKLVETGLIDKADSGLYREKNLGHWSDNT